MKKLMMMVVLTGALSVRAQEKKEQIFKFSSGVSVEPQIKNKKFTLPIFLNTSVIWKEHVKLTFSGGYVVSKEVNAPMVVGEFGYEFENNFEPYIKGEQVFSKEDVTNYYAVGLSYNIKITKHFTLLPFAEYGRENHDYIGAFGLHCAYQF